MTAPLIAVTVPLGLRVGTTAAEGTRILSFTPFLFPGKKERRLGERRRFGRYSMRELVQILGDVLSRHRFAF
jgi:hypothetical protein